MGVSSYEFSSNLLQLKFMRNAIHEERRREHANSHPGFINLSDEMKDGSHYIMEPSCINCEGAKFGRLSYQGMNSDIERLMEQNQQAENTIKVIIKKEENVDTTAEEMAQTYAKLRLNKMIGKKFCTKRKVKSEPQKLSPKKPKFLKPSDN